jgi:hypothetical protein
VTNAHALLDHNPTHAAALLKKIPETSERAADARAVAQAAIVRGAAWTMQLADDDLTVYGELSLDGKFFLQVGRDGVIHVWDLDRKKLVMARTFAKDARATWAGRALFVSSETGASELVDPFAGTSVRLDLGPVRWATATDAGDRIAFFDPHGAAFVLDVARKAATPVWPGHAVTALVIAFDGRWIALGDKAGVEVVDANGRELTSRPGAAVNIVGSRFGSLAVHAVDGVALCTLGAQPVWTPLDFTPFPGQPLTVAFRGRELDTVIAGTTIKVISWNGERTSELLGLPGLTAWMVEAGDEMLVVPGNDGQLHFVNGLARGALHLPVTLEHLKLFARPGVARVIAVGTGLLAGFDLQDSLPERLRLDGSETTFVDDTTLLSWRPEGGTWTWYDVRTRQATPFTYNPTGLAQIIDVDPSDGRMLVRETANDTGLYMIRKGQAERRVLVHGSNAWGKLLPKDALVFGVGDGRVFAVGETRRANEPGAPQPREVVKLTGVAAAAVSFGDSGYAALSLSGELARGDYLTGALTRAHVAPGESAAIAADRAGHVLVAENNRVLLWSRDVVELAKLDKPVARLVATDSGALAELTDHSVVLVPLVPGAPTQLMLPPSDQAPVFSEDGKLMIGLGVNKQLVVVELDARGNASPWDLPTYFSSLGLVAISPTSRRFVQTGFDRAALWSLPRVSGELRAWLDDRTNAVADRHDALAWPWQAASKPTTTAP